MTPEQYARLEYLRATQDAPAQAQDTGGGFLPRFAKGVANIPGGIVQNLNSLLSNFSPEAPQQIPNFFDLAPAQNNWERGADIAKVAVVVQGVGHALVARCQIALLHRDVCRAIRFRIENWATGVIRTTDSRSCLRFR